jgi:hypothetical protein
MVVLPKNYLKVAELTQTVERMPKFHEKMNKLIIVINLAFSLFQFGQSFLLKEVTSTGLSSISRSLMSDNTKIRLIIVPSKLIFTTSERNPSYI